MCLSWSGAWYKNGLVERSANGVMERKMNHEGWRSLWDFFFFFFFPRTVGTLIRALVSGVLSTSGKHIINQLSSIIWLEMLAITAQMCTIWKFYINWLFSWCDSLTKLSERVCNVNGNLDVLLIVLIAGSSLLFQYKLERLWCTLSLSPVLVWSQRRMNKKRELAADVFQSCCAL